MIKAATLASVIFSGTLLCPDRTTREPFIFFKKQIGLSDDQIAAISRGKTVVKVLPSKPAEIFIFSAVFVNATPEEYVKLAFDMSWRRRSSNYLGAGRFSNPPMLSDLDDFTLEPEDIKDLKICRPGKCGVQLPADAMLEIQKALDWSDHNVSTQVNTRVRRMILDILWRYQADGNRALGSYCDTDHPFDVDAQLQSLLSRSEALPVYLPELTRYLLEYPIATLADVESLFYWERAHFGLKPMLRLNHAIAYRSAGSKGTVQVVAVKQLYASHYLQLALDLTACVTESGRTSDKGFFLISLKGSTQQGLTGLKGSLLRRIAVGRTRSAQEKVLINIKKALEEKQ